MALPPDNYNPSDEFGSAASDRRTVGTVIGYPDPNIKEQRGRFLVRFPHSDGPDVPDSKCVWVPTSHFLAPSRGYGLSWPTMFKIGQKVVCENDGGQQGWHIVSAYSNQLSEKTISDFSPLSLGQQEQPVNAAGNFADDKKFNGKPWDQVEKTTRFGHNVINQVVKTISSDGNPLQAIKNQAPTPDKFGRRLPAKILGGALKSIGSEQLTGELLNAQKYMQQVNSPELVPNAINMIETLKSTAQSGSNILATSAVGGISNITGALAGIASAVSAEQSRDNAADEANLLEQLLRALYKLLMKKEPLDQFGNETVGYQKWKADYLLGIIGVADGS